MASATSTPLEHMVAQVRSHAVPSGEWMYQLRQTWHCYAIKPIPNSDKFRFEEHVDSGKLVQGEVEPMDEPWKWSGRLFRDCKLWANITMALSPDGTMRSNCEPLSSTTQRPLRVHAKAKTWNVKPEWTSREISLCVGELVSFWGGCSWLEQSTAVLQTMFDFLDGYNRRYREINSASNPKFDMFMETVAMHAAEHFCRPGFNEEDVVLAVHLMRCLCKRWVFVSRSHMPSLVGEYPAYKALERCRTAFSEALASCTSSRLRQMLQQLSPSVLQKLWEQLEGIVEECEGKEVDHIALLELAGATSQVLGRPLPLKEGSGRKLNLEYLISRCSSQCSNAESFLLNVAPKLGRAAAAAAVDEEKNSRLAHCVKYSCNLNEEQRGNAAVVSMAVSCCPAPDLGQVVMELCRTRALDLPPGDHREANESFLDVVLWPLMERGALKELVPTLIAQIVHMQLNRRWKESEILTTLHRTVEEGKTRWSGLEWNLIVSTALRLAVKSHSSPQGTLVQMFFALGRNPCWEADDLCRLCLDLLDLMNSQAVKRICAADWQPLLRRCVDHRRYPELLQWAVPSLPRNAADLFTFMRELDNQGALHSQLYEGMRTVAEEIEHLSLPLAELLGCGEERVGRVRPDPLASLFLELWVPGVELAPAGSQMEARFLAWLRPETSSTSCEVVCPRLIDRRFRSVGGHMLLEHFMEEVPPSNDPMWTEAWHKIREVPWPSLHELCKVFVPERYVEDRPKSIHFFLAFSKAAHNGMLPRVAYAELAGACQSRGPSCGLALLAENVDTARQWVGDHPGPKFLEQLATASARAEDLLVELRRQKQLLEWLVDKYKFWEVQTQLQKLRQLLGNEGRLSLADLGEQVGKVTEDFCRFDHIEEGGHMAAFLQHFIRSGSCLISPLLEYSASQLSAKLGARKSARSLDYATFCEVVQRCYRNLRILALGEGEQGGGATTVSMQVWRIVLQEFSKAETGKHRELNLLFEFFVPGGTVDSSRSTGQNGQGSKLVSWLAGRSKGQPEPPQQSAEGRRVVLEEALRLHASVALLPSLERALQQMRLDWAVASEAFQVAQDIVERVANAVEVNVDRDSGLMRELEVQLGLSPDLDLRLFDILLQRMSVVDFLVEQGAQEVGGLSRLQQTVSTVRDSLEEDIRVRQALLEELVRCAEVLEPLLLVQARPPADGFAASWTLRETLLAQGRRTWRAETFATVAENIALLRALFDRAAGSSLQLLVFTVRHLLTGELTLDTRTESYCCSYVGSGGEEVVVRPANLLEYVARTLMSLEERGRKPEDESVLRQFLEKMEAITSCDHGLVLTSGLLRRAGHPAFRHQVRMPMADPLLQVARGQAKQLQEWKEMVLRALEGAPLLGLVPRARLHAWLEEVSRDGFRQVTLEAMAQEISQWSAEQVQSPALEQLLLSRGVDHQAPLSAQEALHAVHVCFQGRQLGASRTREDQEGSRFMVQAERCGQETVLLLVAHLFLRWGRGPGRLPRLPEVLFCAEDTELVEVEAFLWRCEHFPQLLFVLCEPNQLPLQGKKRVAEWLAVPGQGASVCAILTAPWHIPTSSRVQPLDLRPERGIVESHWKPRCEAELMLATGSERPLGLGAASGKSTAIRQTCEQLGRKVVPFTWHEGARLPDLLDTLHAAIVASGGSGEALALHIDISAYTNPVPANTFLKELMLCQVLSAPESGLILPIPSGLQVYVEVGPLAGDRDLHSSSPYATGDCLQAKFPEMSRQQLEVVLQYPVLKLLARDINEEVRGMWFLDGENRFGDASEPHGEERTALPLRVMEAFLQPHPMDHRRRLIDIRYSDLETVQVAVEFGEPGEEHLRVLRLCPDGDGIGVQALPDTQRALTVLQEFGTAVGAELDGTWSQKDMVVRLLAGLANWMNISSFFRASDGPKLAGLGSLLVGCVGVSLAQACRKEEACLHFVPSSAGRTQGDFRVFVGDLALNPYTSDSAVCRRGPECRCNELRRQLLDVVGGQVLMLDPACGAPLEVAAEEDARQGAEAVATALSLDAAQVRELLQREGYALTRDFASKMLELHRRRQARIPVVISGESGTGKSRLMGTYMRLLLESDEVCPPLLRTLYDYMRGKLILARDDPAHSLQGMVAALEEILNVLLEEGFCCNSLKTMLRHEQLYASPPDGDALYSRREMLEFLVTQVRQSPRFDEGLLHLLMAKVREGAHPANLKPNDWLQEQDDDFVRKAEQQWCATPAEQQAVERQLQTIGLLFQAAGAELPPDLAGQDMDPIPAAAPPRMPLPEAARAEADALELLVELLARLPPQRIFFQIQLHAAMSPAELLERLQPALAACRRESNMTIMLFLDEVNTSSCLGLVKAIMCDELLKEEYRNLFVVAAGNPYREEHIISTRAGKTVMRDFFQVHPLPPSFEPLTWQWQTPPEECEARYVLVQLERDLPGPDRERFAGAVVGAQRFMRQELRSDSAVSQRDIIRVIKVFKFFCCHQDQAQATQERSDRIRRARSLLLAFGLCYYLGLNTEQRERFEKEVVFQHFQELMLDESTADLTLPGVLGEEMELYMQHVHLPPGVAKTQALKENVFAIIIGIQCCIPVMIVGMPGTGKTLSVNIAANTLRGLGAVPFFRAFPDVANSVFRYQCSKDSTSRQIQEVFELALEAQGRIDRQRDCHRRAIVFIDEAGLPDEQVESLKAIHYFMDRGDLACVLLANQPLDAAKRNRALQVFRDTLVGEVCVGKSGLRNRVDRDLQLLAGVCLGVDLADEACRKLVDGLCMAFQRISSSPEGRFNSFFHLRDFHHCLRYLRHRGLGRDGALTGGEVLRALERNFGGLPRQDFSDLADIFFAELESATQGAFERPDCSAFREPLAVLREALEDTPDMRTLGAHFDPCRYKLLVDETEDGGAIRILQDLNILKADVDIIEVSDLPGDRSQLTTSRVVSAIRLAAEQPRTCVITDFKRVLDGFYDLLNLRFQHVPIPDTESEVGERVGYAATVAAGSYSVLTPVHPLFQLVVCIRASELPRVPLPFLNRFEKQRIAPLDLASARAVQVTGGQISCGFLQQFLLQPARERLEALVQLLGPASFLGLQIPGTLDSAMATVLEACPALHKELLSFAGQLQLQTPVHAGARAQSHVKWPVDLPEGGSQGLCTMRAEQESQLRDMKLHGHVNAGSTCYLQAILTVLAAQKSEQWQWHPDAADGRLGRGLQHVLSQARCETVNRKQMEALEEMLACERLVERGQQHDAALVLETLLERLGAKALPLQTVTRTTAEAATLAGLLQVTGLPEPTPVTEHLLRVSMSRGGAGSRGALLSELLREGAAVEAVTEGCMVELPGEGKHHLNFALRLLQRLPGRPPPPLLPICLERWRSTADGRISSKDESVLQVPLRGLGLPLLSPNADKSLVLEKPELELWAYDLRSFVCHRGSLASGHYHAYWRAGGLWQCIDNESARRVSSREAEEAAGCAYLLFYELSSFRGDASAVAGAGSDGLDVQGLASPGPARESRVDLQDAIARLAEEAARQLLQLVPSETVLCHMAALPQELRHSYASAPHTGLGALLRHMSAQQGRGRRCLVFTRDVLHAGNLEQLGVSDRLDVEVVPLLRSRRELQDLLVKRDRSRPLVVYCRVADGLDPEASEGLACTHRAVHQLRRLVDQRDEEQVAIVLLLPPWRLHVGPCYESFFLGAWDIFHLDTVDDAESPALVSSLLCGDVTIPTMREEQFASQEELRHDLWLAVARLPADGMANFAQNWEDHAAAFYDPRTGLDARVQALWAWLQRPAHAELLLKLRGLSTQALSGVSVQQEALQAAKDIMGMGAKGARSLLCLQATLKAQAMRWVTSALVHALWSMADLGGLCTIQELGAEAAEIAALYLDACTTGQQQRQDVGLRRLSPPASGNKVLAFFPPLFQALQSCLLEECSATATLPGQIPPLCTEQEEASTVASTVASLLRASLGTWEKQPLAPIALRVAQSPSVLQSYSRYVCARLGLMLEVGPGLVSWVEGMPERERLLGLHAGCSQHRSDLATLGALFQGRELPPGVLEGLRSHGDAGGLLGQRVAQSILDKLQQDLQQILSLGCIVDLDTWRSRFQLANAALNGHVPAKSLDQLSLLAFTSDLIPALSRHAGGPQLLQKAFHDALETNLERTYLQRRLLESLAQQLQQREQESLVLETGRAALGGLLEDISLQLRVSLAEGTGEDADLTFSEAVELVLDVLNDGRGGLFAACRPWPVAQAQGAAVLQSILEVAWVHPRRQHLLQCMSRAFDKRTGPVDVSDTAEFWPPRSTSTWPPDAKALTIAGITAHGLALPSLLYHALRAKPEAAGHFEGKSPLESLQMLPKDLPRSHFARICRSVRKHKLLDAAAAAVVREVPSGPAAQQLARDLTLAPKTTVGASDTVFLFFLDALVVHAGSVAAAGLALGRLAVCAGPLAQPLQSWADALSRPERAITGIGEDPFEDLPRASMPGFEDEESRHLREDREREHLDEFVVAQEARVCPKCGRAIVKTQGCDQMECGRHAHTAAIHQEGCGHIFSWSSAAPYRPRIAAQERQPPGFSALREWLKDREDFCSSQAIAGVEEALRGLSPEDRRYAFANACACMFFKADEEVPALAEALMSPVGGNPAGPLRVALGLEDWKKAHVVAVLCAPGRVLPESRSLVASIMLGRDDWESMAGRRTVDERGGGQLRGILANLLVVIVGGVDNTHLDALLFEPGSLHGTFPVGFVYGAMPGPEGYHYDCGCVLDELGRARCNRPPLQNQHLHFVLFCSWAALAMGLLIFRVPEQELWRVLSRNYVLEVNPRTAGDRVSEVESARSFAMNYALSALDCLVTVQQLPAEDRPLCMAHFLGRLRTRSLADSDSTFGKVFVSSEARERYEGVWGELLDGVVAELPILRRDALALSKTQEQLLILGDFRANLSFMQRFFHRFDACGLSLPVEPQFAFVRTLLNSREELMHLPLLREIVLLQNWVQDRLNGAVPAECLKQPLFELLERRRQEDRRSGHWAEELRCDAALAALQRFADGWGAFHRANNGQIPIECQAGREAAGLGEGQRTRLSAVDGDGSSLLLQFFVDGEEKSEPRLVAEHLRTRWDLVVSAAADALRRKDIPEEHLMAEQMEREIPVWLSDLFIQDRLVGLLQGGDLELSVLRHLTGAAVLAPVVDWSAAQESLLCSHWRTMQRLSFPDPPPFEPRRSRSSSPSVSAVAGQRQTQAQAGESEELPVAQQQAVLEKVGQLRPRELQLCREAVDFVVQLLSGRGRGTVQRAGELAEVQARLADWPLTVRELVQDAELHRMPALLKLLQEESGEFARLSPLLKAPLPSGVDLAYHLDSGWPPVKELTSMDALAKRDAALREAITDLENESFTHYLLDRKRDTGELRQVCLDVFAPGGTLDPPLSQLPECVRGSHLVAVLQVLRGLLWDVRQRKANLDSRHVWSAREGLQPIPGWALTAEAAVGTSTDTEEQGELSSSGNGDEAEWWLAESPACDQSPPQEALPTLSVAPSAVSNAELLPLLRWACDEQSTIMPEAPLPDGSEDLLRRLGIHAEELRQGISEKRVGQLLDACARHSIESECAWQRALSGTVVTPLESILEWDASLTLEAVAQALWGQEAPAGFGSKGSGAGDSTALPGCRLPQGWLRFVGVLLAEGARELETSVWALLGEESRPCLVTAPRTAESAVRSGQRLVLLHYGQRYYRVCPAVDAGANNLDPLLELKAKGATRRIQRAYRRYRSGRSTAAAAAGMSADGPVKEAAIPQGMKHISEPWEIVGETRFMEQQGAEEDEQQPRPVLLGADPQQPGQQPAVETDVDLPQQGTSVGQLSPCTSCSSLRSATPSVAQAPRLLKRGKHQSERFVLEAEDFNLEDLQVINSLPEFEATTAASAELRASFLAGALACVPEDKGSLMTTAWEKCCQTIDGALKTGVLTKVVPDLEASEVLALLLYGFDARRARLRETASSSFYLHFRRVVREQDPEALLALSDYLYHFQSGLLKLRPVDGLLFCGVPADATPQLAELDEGQRLWWLSFTSCTPDAAVAREAAGQEGMVLELLSHSARDLSNINQWSKQVQGAEAVLLPGTSLVVLSKSWETVRLQEVDQGT